MPWVKLQMLRERADVKMESVLKGERLWWRMRVKPRDAKSTPEIVAEAPDIEDVVRQGVRLSQDAGLLPRG